MAPRASPHHFLLALLYTQASTASPLVTVSRTRVTYRGTTSSTVEHFQNIRFAYSTSGHRRFAPPEPFVPEPDSIIDTTSPGPACPQTRAAMPPFFAETQQMSEDCLNLRIARPVGTTEGSKLPVVVWVHGGGVVKGSAYDPHFDPSNLITLSTSLNLQTIYVAFNYRLTIFGFARTATLREEKSLNVGFRDQQLALQWVKDNIEAFGGDAERITVFGLSAGGTFASLHLMAYSGEQGVPFQRVWSMSGPPGTALNMSSNITEHHTGAVARKVGCEEDDLLKCLRTVPMELLLNAAMEYSVQNHPPVGLFTFIPSLDGDLFNERPSVSYKQGDFIKGIRMVFGWTQDDGALNVGPVHLIRDEESMRSSIRNFAHALDDTDFKKLFELYPAWDFELQLDSYRTNKAPTDPDVSIHFFRVSRIIRDMLFTCSSIDFAQALSTQASVRLYTLNQSMFAPLFRAASMSYIDVPHGSDTNYIFGGLFPEGEISEGDQTLSRMMTAAFLMFAATVNPDALADGEEWPEAFGEHELTVNVLEGPLGTGPGSVVWEDDARRNASISGLGGDRDELEMGAMDSVATRKRSEVLAKEKLRERRVLVNSLAEKLGV